MQSLGLIHGGHHFLEKWFINFISPVWYTQSPQSCLTLWDTVDCGPPGSSVHGIFQARILERVAISSTRRSSGPRVQTHVSCVSCIADRFFTHWAIREALQIFVTLTVVTKIYLKWIKDLNVRPKIIKQLGKIFEKNLLDADLVNDFLDMTPKAKTKMNKLDYIKLKSLCRAKERPMKCKGNVQNGRTYLQTICLIRG